MELLTVVDFANLGKASSKKRGYRSNDIDVPCWPIFTTLNSGSNGDVAIEMDLSTKANRSSVRLCKLVACTYKSPLTNLPIFCVGMRKGCVIPILR